MILYHAISTFQLLECMVHHLVYTKDKEAVIVLPDFIVDKFPQYKQLQKMKLFKKVRLLKYMLVPHSNDQTIMRDIAYRYKNDVKYRLDKFEEVYCAGAHFYFSLYLISMKKPFIAFEDAAGMLSRDEEMYRTLSRQFPVHAEIAKRYGLFSLDNEYIKKVICHKASQTKDVSADRFMDFDPVAELQHLDDDLREEIVSFFVDKTYSADNDSIILLTQHFSVLGNMSLSKQEKVYDYIIGDVLKNEKVIIKPHPDDLLDYESRYKSATVIHEKFPSELLPFVFNKRPERLITINSTGAALLKGYFDVKIMNNYMEELKNDTEVFL